MKSSTKIDMNLLERIKDIKIDENEILISWLGQAGFIIKDHLGATLTIDPYLSNYGERVRGFKRISPILINPEDLNISHYITTHKHFDHYDYDTIPIVLEKYSTKFYGPISSLKEFEKLEKSKEKMTLLKEWNEIEIEKNIRLLPTFADHGELEPDAIGLILKIDDIEIYISGDTSLRLDKLTKLESSNPDIFIASINGKFGNLNNEEGVTLANYINAKSIIPCHFWTFLEHGGSPEKLSEEMEIQNSKAQLNFLTPGEIYKFSKDQGYNKI